MADPFRFDESIRWTIEHGHANNIANGYASVAMWYRAEPHASFPVLPGSDAMRRSLPDDFDDVRLWVLAGMASLVGPAENLCRIATLAEPLNRVSSLSPSNASTSSRSDSQYRSLRYLRSGGKQAKEGVYKRTAGGFALERFSRHACHYARDSR